MKLIFKLDSNINKLMTTEAIVIQVEFDHLVVQGPCPILNGCQSKVQDKHHCFETLQIKGDFESDFRINYLAIKLSIKLVV